LQYIEEAMLERCMYAAMSPLASLRHDDDESGVIPRVIGVMAMMEWESGVL
jgi:hypothetical protein